MCIIYSALVFMNLVHHTVITCGLMSHGIHTRRLVSSVGRAPVCCAGGRWFVPQTGPTLRVLK